MISEEEKDEIKLVRLLIDTSADTNVWENTEHGGYKTRMVSQVSTWQPVTSLSLKILHLQIGTISNSFLKYLMENISVQVEIVFEFSTLTYLEGLLKFWNKILVGRLTQGTEERNQHQLMDFPKQINHSYVTA